MALCGCCISGLAFHRNARFSLSIQTRFYSLTFARGALRGLCRCQCRCGYIVPRLLRSQFFVQRAARSLIFCGTLQRRFCQRPLVRSARMRLLCRRLFNSALRRKCLRSLSLGRLARLNCSELCRLKRLAFARCYLRRLCGL